MCVSLTSAPTEVDPFGAEQAEQLPFGRELGLDCFVTGEPEEDSPILCADSA